mmetsp:Transcript_18400/g.26523  ORF Transcript_18400/g.26523 Transcript_18400/m.26523 type:complete len:286 (+) Transcript_18400:34-891(+)
MFQQLLHLLLLWTHSRMSEHHIVDNMSEADLRINFKIIHNENAQLKLVNGAIAEKLNGLSSEVVKLTEKNRELHAKAISDHLLVEQNDNLRQTLEELKKENVMLKIENEILRNKLNDYEKRISELEARENDYEKRISELEARDEPITVREAVRILEAYICLEAVGGSKTKFKNGNHNFDAISKTSDPKVTAKLANILSVRGLSKDHLATISYLKDCGDFGAHASRPAMTKEEWIVALTGEDVDEASEADKTNDEEEKQLALAAVKIKTELLSVLEAYNPCIHMSS